MGEPNYECDGDALTYFFLPYSIPNANKRNKVKENINNQATYLTCVVAVFVPSVT